MDARVDPGTASGAHIFSAEGGYDPQTGRAYYAVTGHDAKGRTETRHVTATTTDHGYLDPNTGSARNIALTSTGMPIKSPNSFPLKARWEPSGPHQKPVLWNDHPGRLIDDETDQDPAALGHRRDSGLRHP